MNTFSNGGFLISKKDNMHKSEAQEIRFTRTLTNIKCMCIKNQIIISKQKFAVLKAGKKNTLYEQIHFFGLIYRDDLLITLKLIFHRIIISKFKAISFHIKQSTFIEILRFLRTLYLTVSGKIIPSLKLIGQF